MGDGNGLREPARGLDTDQQERRNVLPQWQHMVQTVVWSERHFLHCRTDPLVDGKDRFVIKRALGSLIIVASIGFGAAQAQQIYGTPGAPSATMSIDGKQLPPPPPAFGGVIKEDAK